MSDKDRAYWLADKIPAYGDYAKEAAFVLRQQADRIEQQEQEIELLRIQKADAFEALADEREKYEELDKICRAQHEAINTCANHLREAQLALMAFIDSKADIYEESRKRAKARRNTKTLLRSC